MKIRKDIDLNILTNYGYHYEENLYYPTYQKRKRYGDSVVTIDILVKTREIFINKSNYITKKNGIFIRDLIANNLIDS